jgi:hypothetical protein
MKLPIGLVPAKDLVDILDMKESGYISKSSAIELTNMLIEYNLNVCNKIIDLLDNSISLDDAIKIRDIIKG